MSTRILVIDDEPNIRRMMRITLETDGYEVEDAGDGKGGLELFGDGSRFDAVVLDQKMPGMDGLETLKQIRRRSPDASVVMATAYASIELAVDAMKAGATDFLKKPLTPDTLRGAVLAAVAKRSSRPSTSPSPPAPADSSLHLPAADVWTVNGFFIRGLAGDSDEPHEHRFSVRHAGRGPHGDVVVTLNASEMARIARLAGRTLPIGTAFWQKQAERALMNYLFEQANLPPDGRLMVNRLPDETVLQAREWKGTS